MLKGTEGHGETHWITKQGQRRLIAWSNTMAVREGGAVEYVIRTGVDVTDRETAQEQVRDSDAAVRTLLETAPDAVMAHDAQGRILFVNAAAEAMFGYKRKELIGQPLAMLIPERFRQRHAGHVANFFLKPAMRPMGSGLDLFGLRKDGSEFPAEIGLSYFKTKDGMLGVSFVADITERKKNEATMLQNQKELQALTARLLGLQEAGNKDLARELHDDLSQKLAALGMEVSTLLQPSGPPDSLPDRVRALSVRINDLAEGVHALSRRLHPAVLDELGLEAALREECVAFSAQAGIPCEVQSRGVPISLPEDVSLCLYRVAQESLRNIAKHAEATKVRVALSGEKAGIGLRVEDTGDGFDLKEVEGERRTWPDQHGRTGAVAKRQIHNRVAAGRGHHRGGLPAVRKRKGHIENATEVARTCDWKEREMKPWRVLLADDHDIVIEGLRRVLAHPEIEIVGAVHDGRALLHAIAQLRPDIIVTDVTMPQLNGIEAARQIHESHPDVKIVFLTMHPGHHVRYRGTDGGRSRICIEELRQR